VSLTCSQDNKSTHKNQWYCYILASNNWKPNKEKNLSHHNSSFLQKRSMYVKM
jgi:hypothetical protein